MKNKKIKKIQRKIEKDKININKFFLVLFLSLFLFFSFSFVSVYSYLDPGTVDDSPSSPNDDTPSIQGTSNSNCYGAVECASVNAKRPLPVEGSDFHFSTSNEVYSNNDFSLATTISNVREYSDYIYGLACNCKFDDSCEGFLNYYCASTKDILPDYLQWTVDIFVNPVNTLCNIFIPQISYNSIDISLENNKLSSQVLPDQKVNAYIQAAKTLNEDEYFYYFKFFFSPSEEYSSDNIVFKLYINGNFETADFKVEPESSNGFTFVKTFNSNKNIEKVCMYFYDKPKGFSSNYICSKVVLV